MYPALPFSLTLILLLLHILGILSAFHSVMHTRTSQSAIAWSIALVTIPYLTLPFYWIFSRNKFHGYVQAFRTREKKISHIAKNLKEALHEFTVRLEDKEVEQKVLERLTELPFTGQNKVDLLVDGEATFSEIFKGIDKAKDYILAQFYIINDDELGNKFKNKLMDAKKRGVSVYLLYDEIGSYSLSWSYISELTEAGVHVHPFKTSKGKSNRFQVNFRNHRKIVVIDGKKAFVGGLNVGDEYMGLDERLSPWRDTHLLIKGPAVQCVQVTFVEDYYWATDYIPNLNWTPVAAKGGKLKALVLSTGPADDFESCNLFFVNEINSAKKRIIIASPYFVPDPQTVSALKLAAMRGVDVQILFPKVWDQKFIWLAAFFFFEDIMRAGVRVFFYEPGFMHQKVMLIDDEISSIGTANFDNRSFRWNFEVSIVVADKDFSKKVSAMIKKDMNASSELMPIELENASFLFRFKVRVARLFSQIL
ncbi:cardiolipin synthase [Thermodesulfobacteriota bacterium]